MTHFITIWQNRVRWNNFLVTDKNYQHKIEISCISERNQSSRNYYYCKLSNEIVTMTNLLSWNCYCILCFNFLEKCCLGNICNFSETFLHHAQITYICWNMTNIWMLSVNPTKCLHFRTVPYNDGHILVRQTVHRSRPHLTTHMKTNITRNDKFNINRTKLISLNNDIMHMCVSNAFHRLRTFWNRDRENILSEELYTINTGVSLFKPPWSQSISSTTLANVCFKWTFFTSKKSRKHCRNNISQTTNMAEAMALNFCH